MTLVEVIPDPKKKHPQTNTMSHALTHNRIISGFSWMSRVGQKNGFALMVSWGLRLMVTSSQQNFYNHVGGEKRDG